MIVRMGHVAIACFAETLTPRQSLGVHFCLPWSLLPTACRLGDASDMAGSPSLFGSSRPWQSVEQYEFLSGSDTSRAMPLGEHTDSSYPDTTQRDRSFSDSAASYTTPTPSRPPTPSPSFSARRLSASASDADSEPASPLLGRARAHTSIRDGSRWWWSQSYRRRKPEGRIWRTFRKGVRRIVRHPLFPQQPITIVRSLISLGQYNYAHFRLDFRSSAFHSLRDLSHTVTHVYPES